MVTVEYKKLIDCSICSKNLEFPREWFMDSLFTISYDCMFLTFRKFNNLVLG